MVLRPSPTATRRRGKTGPEVETDHTSVRRVGKSHVETDPEAVNAIIETEVGTDITTLTAITIQIVIATKKGKENATIEVVAINAVVVYLRPLLI